MYTHIRVKSTTTQQFVTRATATL